MHEDPNLIKIFCVICSGFQRMSCEVPGSLHPDYSANGTNKFFPRIVGGMPAAKGAFPGIVSITLNSP